MKKIHDVERAYEACCENLVQEIPAQNFCEETLFTSNTLIDFTKEIDKYFISQPNNYSDKDVVDQKNLQEIDFQQGYNNSSLLCEAMGRINRFSKDKSDNSLKNLNLSTHNSNSSQESSISESGDSPQIPAYANIQRLVGLVQSSTQPGIRNQSKGSVSALVSNSALQRRIARQMAVQRLRFISKRLSYQYENCNPTPEESVKFVANPIRGKFNEIDPVRGFTNTFGFFVHIQDKWVLHSARLLAATILNGLYTIVVNFHAHSTDLTLSQLERLFTKVHGCVDSLSTEIDVLMRQQRYLCPCGRRFHEAAHFWQHFRPASSATHSPAVGNGPHCLPVDQHVCQCGLVFDQHAAWAQHVLAQDWPVCGLALLAHLFACDQMQTVRRVRLWNQDVEQRLLLALSSSAEIEEGALGAKVTADLARQHELEVHDDCRHYECCGCAFHSDNFLFYTLHVVYCDQFAGQLEKNCPFCKFRYGITYYDQTAAAVLTDSKPGDPSSAAVRSEDRPTGSIAAACNSENWTLALCKICLLFGITIEDVLGDE